MAQSKPNKGWLFHNVKYSAFLTNLSGTLRPAAYEDKAPSFRRNMLYLLAIFVFIILASLIFFYQLRERPIIIKTSLVSINLGFVNGDQTMPMWDSSATQWLLDRFWEGDNGGDQIDCNCYGQNFYFSDQFYPYFSPSELSACLRFVPDQNSKYAPLCRYLDEKIRRTFQSSLLYTPPRAMSPISWEMYIYSLYSAMCASIIVGLGYSESISTIIQDPKYGGTINSQNDTPIDSWISDQEFTDFISLLLKEASSPDAFICSGYTLSDEDSSAVWQFDALLPSPWPAMVERLIPPERVRNHKADGMVMDSSVYEAYLALYCNPTVCTTYARMSVLSVLLNTAGTIATVFSGLMLMSTLCYSVTRGPNPQGLSSPLTAQSNPWGQELYPVDPADVPRHGKGSRRSKRKPDESKSLHRAFDRGARLRVIDEPSEGTSNSVVPDIASAEPPPSVTTEIDHELEFRPRDRPT